MKIEYQSEITFDQLLSLVKKLPIQQKLKLTQELEKEAIDSKLSKLLKIFKTDELSLDVVNDEVEIVRQQFYDDQKS